MTNQAIQLVDANRFRPTDSMKIAVVLRGDLPTWKKLNVTAFTMSGVAGIADTLGEIYKDGSGNEYLPMVKDPVMVYASDEQQLRRVLQRIRTRNVPCSIFPDELFSTFDDSANRAAVSAIPDDRLSLAGLALRAEKKVADKILRGLKLHP
ncbi:DUF2000 family protein [Paraburkholderia sp. GAS199]|uniref:DUF2000 family protein n=1 Tax=Paraburkholderia sp. GAS199 TaxID=3035126 RepID=UPI003D1B13A1